MSNKIKLGARPKSFTRVIKFPMHDGTTGRIEVTYKYRTRSEFGEFVDGLVDAAKARGISEADAADFSMGDFMSKQAGANASYLMQVMESWDLDEPFNQSNVQQLADELPGAAMAIMETYRAACAEGRLGN